jgi:hypothetical protein
MRAILYFINIIPFILGISVFIFMVLTVYWLFTLPIIPPIYKEELLRKREEKAQKDFFGKKNSNKNCEICSNYKKDKTSKESKNGK